MTDKIDTPDTYTRQKKNDEKKSIEYIQMYFMMYEAYDGYYRNYTIEKIIKSFTENTLQRDYKLKMRILNGLGLYSVIIYRRLLTVRDRIKGTLLQSNPDFNKAKTMLTKIQTLINSTANEVKKEKLLKIRKNLVNEIDKFTENKKNNPGQEHQHHKNKDKYNFKNKFEEKKGFDKNSKPYNKSYGDKKYNKKYKKSNNNNVSL